MKAHYPVQERIQEFSWGGGANAFLEEKQRCQGAHQTVGALSAKIRGCTPVSAKIRGAHAGGTPFKESAPANRHHQNL